MTTDQTMQASAVNPSAVLMLDGDAHAISILTGGIILTGGVSATLCAANEVSRIFARKN